MSRIGNRVLNIPAGVSVTKEGKQEVYDKLVETLDIN